MIRISKFNLNRLFWHIGSSIAAYCTLVAIRSGHGADEYHYFHPYIAAWIIGVNMTIFAITNLGHDRNWF
jgi:hypothetical protein